MGEKEQLINLIGKAREQLAKAQDKAQNTERPANACPAHDSMFSLTQAITGGLDTLLMLRQEDIREEAEQLAVKSEVPQALTVTAPQGLWNQLSSALIADMRTVVITVGVVVALLGLATIYTRQIDKASDFIDRTAETAKDYTGE